MKIYEPPAGENVSETTKRMIALAKKTKETVTAKFNEIELTANSDSSAESIVVYYREESARRAETYRNSPEGKKAAREREENKAMAQQKHDVLMLSLPNLNFADDVAVLDWLCEFQDPSDDIAVSKQQNVVLATFATNGYFPNVNTGEAFNKDDRDNFARYIIGQALDNLQCEVGAINPIIHRFTYDWKKKFLVAVVC